METPRLIAGRYSIRSVLGRGGMGEVYLAHDHRLDTPVALKRVPFELALEENIREALVREARILARLSDTHIVRLFDLADTPDGMFLVLEYVCGPSLDKFLEQRQTLSTAELLHLIDQVAQALTRAHSLGIVHRDLKPANLLVALIGEEQRHYLHSGVVPATLRHAEIKVADFGLAKMVEQSRTEASGVISGTPAYMAPEQFRGELPGPETDIYSLGFVAYRCLAGTVPLNGAQPVYFHLQVTPPPIDGVPPHINAAIQKAIRKDRRERFHSASEFAEALHAPVVSKLPQEPPKPASAFPKPVAPRYNPFGIRFKKAKYNIPASATIPLAMIFLVLMVMGVITSRTGKQTTYGPATGPAVVTEANLELPPLPPMNPAPRVDQPPPVIEAFRPAASPHALPPGIQHPRILSQMRVPGHNIWGFGPDGTLYLTSDHGDIAALRDGKLLWQYRLGGDSGKFVIAPNGLIWILTYYGGDRLFCFNAAGQGGEFVDHAAIQKYTAFFRSLQPPGPIHCLDPGEHQNEPAIAYLAAGRPIWETALDQRCENDPTVSSDGKILVQTESRTLYLLSPQGHILWTYSSACQFHSPFTMLPGGTAVGACSEGKTLLGIQNGRQSFSITSKTSLSDPFAVDNSGSFYRFVDSEIYNQSSLVKTDLNGHDIWTFSLQSGPGQSSSAMSPTGNVFLLNSTMQGSVAITIGDSSN